MSIISAIGGLLGGIAKPVTDVLNKRTERKMAEEAAKAKIKLNQQQGDQTVELTDAEAEALRWRSEGQSWKDEFVTVLVVGSVFFGMFAGSVLEAFGYPELLSAVLRSVAELEAAGVRVGFLCEAVVLAAVGLKIWRGR